MAQVFQIEICKQGDSVGPEAPQSLESPWLWASLFCKIPWQAVVLYLRIPLGFGNSIVLIDFSAPWLSCIFSWARNFQWAATVSSAAVLPSSPDSQVTFDCLIATSFQLESHIWPGWWRGLLFSWVRLPSRLRIVMEVTEESCTKPQQGKWALNKDETVPSGAMRNLAGLVPAGSRERFQLRSAEHLPKTVVTGAVSVWATEEGSPTGVWIFPAFTPWHICMCIKVNISLPSLLLSNLFPEHLKIKSALFNWRQQSGGKYSQLSECPGVDWFWLSKQQIFLHSLKSLKQEMFESTKATVRSHRKVTVQTVLWY